ncbi:hypothetical protein AYO21_06166 [Fonsecaea monophora]|uniref:Uncharacterized protein n=1 Tax=Fonsecaea monophora TaxID=254056 RepID=A0A177F7W5_9EURO|nr:hypothetical protein AYO21_06166 [Fonsecaea monophora]OAG39522.1 hypothetical protein AYO21_06166 [Fonsecaea monophora]
MAMEQWLSAHQSVRIFHGLGHPEWTTRHGFYADMGGILIAPRDYPAFPVDSQQLAYLVEHKSLVLPEISALDIEALNKADGLARLVTLIQMTWFCVSFIARGVTGLGYSTLEVTTLAFIICTLHTFTFWYYKPLDPQSQRVVPVDANINQLCERPSSAAASKTMPEVTVANAAAINAPIGGAAGAGSSSSVESYSRTPLDFVKPIPDPKSLTIPFWYGFSVVFFYDQHAKQKPAQTMPNSITLPPDGLTMGVTIYTLLFQLVYYGLYIGFAWLAAFPSRTEFYLWLVASCTDFGLILLYILAVPIGAYNTRPLGRYFFNAEATSIPELANMLPPWMKMLLHGPFVFAYIAARAIVLAESLISLRALPASVYQDINWPNFMPHV